VFGQIPLGFILAYALFRKLVGARDFFQSMIYMPTVISTIVIGILWQSFFLALRSVYRVDAKTQTRMGKILCF